MSRKLSNLYKKAKIPRLLQATFVAIAAIFSIAGVAPMAAQAMPSSVAQSFMGYNPSGKLGRDGKPLMSKPLDQLMHTQNNKKMRLNQQTEAFQAECPPTIHCVVMPAAYTPNNGNVEDYGNYDIANRPQDMKINSVVIHDTEGDLQSVLAAFQDPTFYASSHYVIASDGTVYQMVQNKDVAWHAGNWSMNMHSIGIEHVGHSATGGTEYTPEMYKASAKLVKYLTDKYDIPRDRGHILGHDNVPSATPGGMAGMHTDPGPYWNWQYYMAMIGGHKWPLGDHWHKHKREMVTVAPVWPLNKQSVTGCTAGTESCVPADAQSTNFVYLRTEPQADAPLFTDPALGQGTTEIDNTSARLYYGQTFAVADKKTEHGGIWYKIWVNGATGWFFSPWRAPTAYPSSAKYVTPKTSESVPVYGRAIPERSEYPADLLAVPPASWYVPTPTPISYTVTEGQRYKLIGEVPTDHFYAWASDSSFPYDHTVFHGATKYLEIQIGNRVGYVKADSVDIH